MCGSFAAGVPDAGETHEQLQVAFVHVMRGATVSNNYENERSF
jgi:hypothetical protein